MSLNPLPPTRQLAHEMVLGALVGIPLVLWSGTAYLQNQPLIDNSISETIWVAIYLTMVVAYADFKLPVFGRTPQQQTFFMVLFCGHISLLFDSFAVVLLLQTGVVMTAVPQTRFSFNAFALKASAAFAALTVGGAFYLGELWGLPYYINSGLNQPLVGLPLLTVLTPFNVALAWATARYFPVSLEAAPFDKKQVRAAVEFTVALLLIITTHSPYLCIGLLLVYTAMCKSTTQLVEKFVHEFRNGAENAIGLILVALILVKGGWAIYITPHLTGPYIFLAAAASSPLAGSLTPGASSLHEFYVSLSWLMLGAPLFVFSSLVAIVVFREHIVIEETPLFVQKAVRLLVPQRSGETRETVAEAILYTIFVIPMNIVLGLGLWLGNTSGIFLWVARLIGVTMP